MNEMIREWEAVDNDADRIMSEADEAEAIANLREDEAREAVAFADFGRAGAAGGGAPGRRRLACLCTAWGTATAHYCTFS